jgi:hypothetical protein
MRLALVELPNKTNSPTSTSANHVVTEQNDCQVERFGHAGLPNKTKSTTLNLRIVFGQNNKTNSPTGGSASIGVADKQFPFSPLRRSAPT